MLEKKRVGWAGQKDKEANLEITTENSDFQWPNLEDNLNNK